MVSLAELKDWLRVDFDDDDISILTPLILASRLTIKESTGVIADDVVENAEATELYKTLQKVLITDIYENRSGASLNNSMVITLSTHLVSFKGLPDEI